MNGHGLDGSTRGCLARGQMWIACVSLLCSEVAVGGFAREQGREPTIATVDRSSTLPVSAQGVTGDKMR